MILSTSVSSMVFVVPPVEEEDVLRPSSVEEPLLPEEDASAFTLNATAPPAAFII